MTKYIIRVTYTDGDHEGKEYYLNKGGYVIDRLSSVWKEDSYTLSGCRRVCKKKEEQNTAEVIFERRERERRIKDGKTVSKYPIYHMQHYEPFAIETVDE